MKRTIYLLCLFLLFISVTFFCSCNAYKNLPYLKDADTLKKDELASIAEVHEPRIMPNDIISISVNSNIPGAAADFNLPIIPTNSNSPIQTSVTNTTTASGSLQNYIVNKDGTINFPILGELKLSGMSAKEAQDYISSLISPKYISSKPIINIRFLNFEVSVLGEVNKPGIYSSKNGNMTILDALAAAGDMTIYGQRNNVMLVRIKENGELAFHKLDLHDKSLALQKDLFFLQQNDKLYIQTNKAKGNSSRFGTFESIGLTAVSIIVSLFAIITR